MSVYSRAVRRAACHEGKEPLVKCFLRSLVVHSRPAPIIHPSNMTTLPRHPAGALLVRSGCEELAYLLRARVHRTERDLHEALAAIRTLGAVRFCSPVFLNVCSLTTQA